MSQATTLILLSSKSGPLASFSGDKQPAAAYYLGGQTLQTVTWSLTSMKGQIFIEASLADNPTSNSDWFTVKIIADFSIAGLTQSSFENVNGSFVWLRARIVDLQSGSINSVKVTY